MSKNINTSVTILFIMEHATFEIERGIILEGIINGNSDTFCAAVTKQTEDNPAYCLLYRVTTPMKLYGRRFEAAELRTLNRETKAFEMLQAPAEYALLPHELLCAGDIVYLPTAQLTAIPKIDAILSIKGISELVSY